MAPRGLKLHQATETCGGGGGAPRARGQLPRPAAVSQDQDWCSGQGRGFRFRGQAVIWDWKLGDPHVSIHAQTAHKQAIAAVRRARRALVV